MILKSTSAKPRSARWLPYRIAEFSRAFNSRCCRRMALVAFALLSSSFLAGPSYAGELSDAQLTPQEREQAFAELDRDVAELEKRLGILKRVVRLVGPSVVHIEASRSERLTYGKRGRVEEAGSGILIAIGEKTFVLTNRHVIKNSTNEQIRIKVSDGRQLAPLAAWSDPGTDVAVMEVSASDLTAARIGNSDNVEIGDYVIAFGSPFGLSRSVTHGIVSAKGRRDLELGDDGVRFQNFLQTDAAINPGNSGGPLVSLRGELIGINTAIASSSGGNEGIGFTIPINVAMSVARQLVQNDGRVARAFLGVNLDARFGPTEAARIGLPVSRGARISGITEDSPAQQAELQVDDVVVQFNGVRVEDDTHLVNLVGLSEVGREVPVVIFRKGKLMRLNVRVAERGKFLSE